MAVDDQLGKRLPSIDQATRYGDDEEPPSPMDIARKVAEEAKIISTPTREQRGSNHGEGESTLALHASAISDAINEKNFQDCENACKGIDTSTAQGRRSILEQGLLANCALITKVILKASKELARRHPLLSLMLEARGGQGISGIVDYFSHAHAMDPLTEEVPQRRQKFSVAGEAGTCETEIRKFIQCKFLDMDWFCPATGIYALRMCDTGARLAPLDKRDHYCTELEDLIEFGTVRLTAAGFPTHPQSDAAGFTWQTWWTRYHNHLKLAKRANTKQEMIAWVHQTDIQGRASMRLIGADFFSQLALAAPSVPLLGIYYLNPLQVQENIREPSPIFIVEKRS